MKSRLEILDEKEIQDIVDEYSGYIEEKKAKGLTEEQAIEEFGDFDELVKEILSAYKIKNDYKKTDTINEVFDNTVNVFTKLFNKISEGGAQAIIKFILELFIIIILLAVFRLPVDLLENIGEDIFGFIVSPIDDILISIWNFIVEVFYIIFSIAFIVKTFKERYDLNDEPKKAKAVKVNNDETKNEEKADDKIKVEKKPSSLIDILIKTLLIIIYIPLVSGIIGLCIALAVTIYFVVIGVPYIGVPVVIFGVITFFGIFLDIAIKLIENKRVSFIQPFISIIVASVFLTVGGMLCTHEVLNTSYYNHAPEYIESTTLENTIDINSSTRLNLPTYNTYFIEDNSLVDQAVITVKYYEDYSDTELLFTNNVIELKNYTRDYDDFKFQGSLFSNVVIDNLKEYKVYNYTKLYVPETTIRANSSYINRFKSEESYVTTDSLMDEIHREIKVEVND